MFRRLGTDDSTDVMDTSTATVPSTFVSDDDSDLQCCEWSPITQACSTTLTSLPSASPAPPPSSMYLLGGTVTVWTMQFCNGNTSLSSVDLEGAIDIALQP